MCQTCVDSDIIRIFAAKNIPNMIKIVLRSIRDDVGTLSVRIVNRHQNINTFVSLHLKIRTKDWSEPSQLPRNIYDERPVKELNGLSSAWLAATVQEIKRNLVVLDDNNTITMDQARQLISAIVARKTVGDVPAKADTGKPSFTEFVRQYIAECESGERLKQKSTRRVTAGTMKNYRGFLSQLEAYQHARKRVIDWDDLTLDFYRDYKQFFIEKSYSPNTIARHIKTMKTMLYAAKDLHLTTREDFMSRQWSADREDVDNIYIPQDRLRELFTFDMSDYEDMKRRAKLFSKNEEECKGLIHALKRNIYRRKLSDARDIFLIGCLTGQRVSDYKRLSKDMIETIQGDRKFLHIVQVKTEKDVYIPYNDMIEKILNRHGGRLPKVFDQHLNERIKVVGLLLGWTEPAGLSERKGLLEFPSQKRFCDAIVTHTARRTFATNAYKSGVPLSAIMAVTGHASEEMLRRYLKLGTKERALMAAEEFDKVRKA